MGGAVTKSRVMVGANAEEEIDKGIDPNFLENYLNSYICVIDSIDEGKCVLKSKQQQSSQTFFKLPFQNRCEVKTCEVSSKTDQLSIYDRTENDRNLLHTDIRILKEEFDSLVSTQSRMEAMKIFFDDAYFSITIYEVDPDKHINPIIYINKSFTKLTGYKEKDLIGKNHENSLFKRTQKEHKDLFSKSLKDGKSLKLPLVNQSLYGRNICNLLILRPVYFDNDYKYMVGIHCDISDPQCNMSVITYAEKLSRIISYILSN